MTDHPSDRIIPLYIADLLDSEERDAFERALREDPELRQQLKSWSDDMATLSLFSAPSIEPPLGSLDRILDRVRAIETGAEVRAIDEVDETVIAFNAESFRQTDLSPWRLIWPAAAIILLLFNVSLLLDRPELPPQWIAALFESGEHNAGNGEGFLASGSTAGNAQFVAQVRDLENENTDLQRKLETTQALLSSKDRSMKELRELTEQTQSENSVLREEYHRLATRFAPYFESREGVGRFTVIDLRDMTAPASEGPVGFSYIAEYVLQTQLGQNLVSANPANLPGVRPSGSVGTPGYSGGANNLPIPGMSGVDPSTIQPDPGSAQRAAAYSIWRDDEQRGFLDIYNLPDPNPGSVYQVWVRQADETNYTSVGLLDQLDNGSGSFVYKVDNPQFSMAELRVTVEPDGGSAQPTTDPILMGP